MTTPISSSNSSVYAMTRNGSHAGAVPVARLILAGLLGCGGVVLGWQFGERNSVVFDSLLPLAMLLMVTVMCLEFLRTVPDSKLWFVPFVLMMVLARTRSSALAMLVLASWVPVVLACVARRRSAAAWCMVLCATTAAVAMSEPIWSMLLRS